MTRCRTSWAHQVQPLNDERINPSPLHHNTTACHVFASSPSRTPPPPTPATPLQRHHPSPVHSHPRLFVAATAADTKTQSLAVEPFLASLQPAESESSSNSQCTPRRATHSCHCSSHFYRRSSSSCRGGCTLRTFMLLTHVPLRFPLAPSALSPQQSRHHPLT
jgi:hypothetical protein